MFTNRLRLAVLALMLGARLDAQQPPQRLPTVNVQAERPGPGPKMVAGVVKDTMGNPLDGAEVSISALQLRVFTRDDGTFRLPDVRGGTWSIRARKVGYAPMAQQVKIASDGANADFQLIPWMYSMPPVVTTSSRGGLSGIVADTSYAGVPLAEVKVLSTDLITLTDSLGQFFLPARPGNYMVSMRKKGFADRVASVTVPSDSGKFLRAMLYPAHAVAIREAWNIRDLDSRQAWRDKMREPFLTHEDIVKMGYTWIVDMVRQQGMDQYSGDCMVVVNGGPGVTKLGDLTVDDIEAVEIYRASRFEPPRRQPSKLAAPPKPPPSAKNDWNTIKPMSNTNEADFLNVGFNPKCPLVYAWTR